LTLIYLEEPKAELNWRTFIRKIEGAHTEGMEAINQSATPPSTEANINAIVRLEEQALKERTIGDRISDPIRAAMRIQQAPRKHLRRK
jgi:hypothetical protein